MSDPYQPPNSKESEMMVLGCMLTATSSLSMAAEQLVEADFYYAEHKVVFAVMQSFYRMDKPADIHLVAEELKRKEVLHAIGGVAYITSLAQYAGTSAYIEEYIAIVKDKAVLRAMIASAQHVEKLAAHEPADVTAALDEAQQKFFAIGQAHGSKTGEEVKNILAGSTTRMSFLQELEARQERCMRLGPQESAVTGIPTHFVDVDTMINGFNNSHLVILASRPGMGKTAFALNIADNIACKNHIPVGVFSLEMTAEQLVHRLICSQSEVESNKIITGALSPHEFQLVVEAVHRMQQHSIIIDDQPGMTIADVRSRARRMKERHNVGCIIIDYLQLISGSMFAKSADNRQNEISEISRMLKILARELDIPVLCLSQLSRRVEERQGHRPMMSDLRESGCLLGSTMIYDSYTQQSYAMEELAARKEQTPLCVQAMNADETLSWHQMTKVFFSGIKEVFRMTTLSGSVICATANHPFYLLQQGWTPLSDLKNGMLLARAEDNKILWDPVLSIESIGMHAVYDATVEEVHNFVAHGMIVHNSIEQDADIVLFLLRREYYDPYDRPGQAELIVAKNRHGGTGSITLTYRKELAQFANFSQGPGVQYD